LAAAIEPLAAIFELMPDTLTGFRHYAAMPPATTPMMITPLFYFLALAFSPRHTPRLMPRH
jgi:hypothetical protein